MIIFKKPGDLSNHLIRQSGRGIKYGFVPTMGALHDGHLSLIKAARSDNDLVVTSIFINPTQFNNPEDYKYYPVTIENDIEKLEAEGCDIVFLPTAHEMYPPTWQKKHYELGPVENTLEGQYRPGHFQGVCQVVDRFLEIIQPAMLYLGQKDLQQCIVIQKLIDLTGNDVKLVIVPTSRENDGLAMSSRNLRLTPEQRQQSTMIYKVLMDIKSKINEQPFDDLKIRARQELEAKGFIVDYVEIANIRDLSPATSTADPVAALIAATIGNIRLIDNLSLN